MNRKLQILLNYQRQIIKFHSKIMKKKVPKTQYCHQIHSNHKAKLINQITLDMKI